ncbi:phosphatase [Arthrobacter phage RadFad]|nr:phosphatase [Arthrobacter phage RadFad]
MKTTIYLDVDGVLNAVSKRTPKLNITGWEMWQTKPVNGWPILFSPEMIAALNEMADDPDVTFKWLTTWTDDAAKVLSPAIGINGQKWPVLHGEQHGWRGRDWWKLKAIREDVEASDGGRFVWIDDDISAESEAIDWIKSRDDVLALSPFTVQGLTRNDLDAAKAFIAGTEAAA